jgi:tRNA dimethylallyltransferase
MDIGTAKPTAVEQAAAPHHLIDIASPDETLTLASYVDLAKAALDDIWSRGCQPIIVGGTGQYIWALLEGWRVPRVPPDREMRVQLEGLAAYEGFEAVVAQLRQIDPVSAERIDPRNVRRLIRAIEVTRATGRPFSEWQEKEAPAFGATILGLRLDRAALHTRIKVRADAMLDGGLVDEVRALNSAGYDCDLPAMSGIGYRQICEHLAGQCTEEEARERVRTETHRLARMQHTWFKDDDARIHWLDAGLPNLSDEAAAQLST